MCFKTEIASNVKELRNWGFMILIGYNAITYALSFQVLKLVIEKLSMTRSFPRGGNAFFLNKNLLTWHQKKQDHSKIIILLNKN